MKIKRVSNKHMSGKTYYYDKYDFRAQFSPKYASTILAAREHMETHYGTQFTNPVFLSILAHHWLTGKRMEFDRAEDHQLEGKGDKL